MQYGTIVIENDVLGNKGGEDDMNKTSICFPFVVMLFLIVVSLVDAQTPEVIAQKTKESSVLLELMDMNGRTSQGSGFFVGNGLVVTNFHVIDGVKSGTAKLVGTEARHEIEGTVAIDNKHDLAIVKVRNLNAPTLPIGNSDNVRVGEIVYAVGNPRGFEGTFSSGEISNIQARGTARIQDEVLQFTAAISRGSSGGAVVNRFGEVIGIVSETRDDGQNLNFAIPVNFLRTLLNQIGPVNPFPNNASSKNKRELGYATILLTLSIATFAVIWFLPMVKIENWSTAIGVAIGFGSVKTISTAIVRTDSFPLGIKSILASTPPKGIGHALGCEKCILDLLSYAVKFPAYIVFLAFLLGITNVAIKKVELNGFFKTFFVALLIVMCEYLLRLLFVGT